MGTSSSSKTRQQFEQYVCTVCQANAEIMNIDYNEGIIEYKCKSSNAEHKFEIKEYYNNGVSFRSNDIIENEKDIGIINAQKNEEINYIKNKINSLIKQNENNDYIIKFLDKLVTMYEKNPLDNNSINITNIYNDLNNKDNREQILLDKIELLEKKILDVLNPKFEINLTGEDININLSGKKFGNIDLDLLCSISFKKLKELDLSNNNLSNLKEIENLNSPNLAK